MKIISFRIICTEHNKSRVILKNRENLTDSYNRAKTNNNSRCKLDVSFSMKSKEKENLKTFPKTLNILLSLVIHGKRKTNWRSYKLF